MRQIPATELRSVIRFELQRLSKATYRDMGSGHQGTRDRALDTAVDKILARMGLLRPDLPQSSGGNRLTVFRNQLRRFRGENIADPDCSSAILDQQIVFPRDNEILAFYLARHVERKAERKRIFGVTAIGPEQHRSSEMPFNSNGLAWRKNRIHSAVIDDSRRTERVGRDAARRASRATEYPLYLSSANGYRANVVQGDRYREVDSRIRRYCYLHNFERAHFYRCDFDVFSHAPRLAYFPRFS